MLVGGWNGDIYLDSVQIIHLSTQRKLCPNLKNYPIEMAFASGAIVSGNPVICGGYAYAAYSMYPQCYKYVNSTNSWTFLTNMTIGRDFSASVPLGAKYLVFVSSRSLKTREY